MFLKFFKRKSNKSQSSQKDELDFSKLELKNHYNYEVIKDLNIKPIYTSSILFNLIKSNKEEIFENLVRTFHDENYVVKIGIELEFYVMQNPNRVSIIYELKKILTGIENIEKEMGKNQVEIKMKPYTDLRKLVLDYQNNLMAIDNFARENSVVFDFSATPVENDCGSALQINISIVDSDDNNLFAKMGDKESDLMLNCVAGILNNINNNLLLFIKSEKCLERYSLTRNKKLRDDKKYPAPTFVSWGVNNRTAAIRIPTPNKIDIKNYVEENNKNRRIEFRVPSSEADINLVLIGVLSMIYDGVKNDLSPIACKTSFDVMETNEGLTIIECDMKNLQNDFRVNEEILFY